MFRNGKTLVFVGALAAACFAASAEAGSIIGLVDGTSIAAIDPGSRKVTGMVPIKGASNIIGIDVRPADGLVYGITSDGSIVTIDPKSGQATQKSKLSDTLKSGVVATVDFNPVADRLRVMGSDGTSLRVNVDDGKSTVDGSHKFKDGDANAGKTPRIVAGAYSNSVKGTQSTILYGIDAGTNSLVIQAPPNDGVLNTVGPLGIVLDGPVAFNIVMAGERNDAWLASAGSLYSIDLKTGKAAMAGRVDGLSGKLIDLAWMD